MGTRAAAAGHTCTDTETIGQHGLLVWAAFSHKCLEIVDSEYTIKEVGERLGNLQISVTGSKWQT